MPDIDAPVQSFLEAEDDFCTLESTKDDLSDLIIRLDRSKILTAGRKGTCPLRPILPRAQRLTDTHLDNTAVGDFLQKMHIYKSTADVETGASFFTDMSGVGLEYWGSKVRAVVLANKQPRKVYVQANTILDEATGKVECVQYDPTLEGMIQSWAEREP